MMKKKGFSLVSVLVYLAIFSLLSLTCVMGLCQVRESLSTKMVQSHEQVSAFIIGDLISRDIHSALAQVSEWHVVLPDYVVFKTRDKNIGWKQSKNKLHRFEGVYHPESQRWSDYTKRTIARLVENLSISLQQDAMGENIQSVDVSFFYHDINAKERFYLRNGTI